jgi:SagB-type dehydrogenase family enzyme
VATTPTFRRSRALLIGWARDRFCLDLPPTRLHLEVDLATIELLAALDDWTTHDQVAERFPDHDPASVRDAVDQLRRLGVVVDGDDAPSERAAAAWARWTTAALAFHHATTDAPFVRPDDGDSALGPPLADEPPPPLFKAYPRAPRVYLPRALAPIDAGYRDVLFGRRTGRRFADQPLALPVLAALLHHAFAPLHFVDAGGAGVATMRAHASGGGRHEQECYVGVRAADGVPPGLYHYDALGHALEQLRPGFDPARAADLCCGQWWVADAAVVIWVTARFERLMWKYRHPRAYRVLHMNLGSLMQSFSTTATALGLAPFVTAALRDRDTDRYLGVDGVTESVMAVLAAGTPDEPDGALPWPSRSAGLVDRRLVLDCDPPGDEA